MKITKSQLKELIKEEVSKLQKKTILENRKKAIIREMRMLNENTDVEDLYFLVDRIVPTIKVKDVSDYELEKILSQSVMKMNYMNDIIGWVDKDSKLHLMRNDSRILNGEDKTEEIIDYLKSQGYENSPDVPLYEEFEMSDIDMSIQDKAVFSVMNDEDVEDDLSDVIAKYTKQGGDYEGGYKDDISVSPGYFTESKKSDKKMKITKEQLKEIIKEQLQEGVNRLHKKTILEARLKKINEHLSMMEGEGNIPTFQDVLAQLIELTDFDITLEDFDDISNEVGFYNMNIIYYSDGYRKETECNIKLVMKYTPDSDGDLILDEIIFKSWEIEGSEGEITKEEGNEIEAMFEDVYKEKYPQGHLYAYDGYFANQFSRNLHDYYSDGW